MNHEPKGNMVLALQPFPKDGMQKQAAQDYQL